ncbi:MAG: hypothetical protein Q9177_003691 [Variospora cf. flavescens]
MPGSEPTYASSTRTTFLLDRSLKETLELPTPRIGSLPFDGLVRSVLAGLLKLHSKRLQNLCARVPALIFFLGAGFLRQVRFKRALNFPFFHFTGTAATIMHEEQLADNLKQLNQLMEPGSSPEYGVTTAKSRQTPLAVVASHAMPGQQ